MKKLFISVLLSLFIVSCASIMPAKPDVDIRYGAMMNAYEDVYTSYQLDSICEADDLNPLLEEWMILPLRDDVLKENISQYIYIKSLGSSEIIYRVQDLGDGYFKITKRITK